MTIAELIRAEQATAGLVDAANKFAYAVKAREAYLAQETALEPDSAEAAEAAAFLVQLDAGIRRYQNEMLAKLNQ